MENIHQFIVEADLEVALPGPALLPVVEDDHAEDELMEELFPPAGGINGPVFLVDADDDEELAHLGEDAGGGLEFVLNQIDNFHDNLLPSMLGNKRGSRRGTVKSLLRLSMTKFLKTLDVNKSDVILESWMPKTLFYDLLSSEMYSEEPRAMVINLVRKNIRNM